MRTVYAHPNVDRTTQQTSFYDGLHPCGEESKTVFNLIATYEHPERGSQIDTVGQTFSRAVKEAWERAGDLPSERTEDYVPVLTKAHIFGSREISAEVSSVHRPALAAAA